MLKKRKYIILILSVLCLVIGGGFVHWIYNGFQTPAVNMVEVNRIRKNAELGIEGARAPEEESKSIYDYAVLDRDGRLLYSAGVLAPLSMEEAIRSHSVILDVEMDGTVRGNVLIYTGYEPELIRRRNQMVILTVIMFAAVMVFIISYGRYLDRKLYRPFQKLQDFARHVAMGNLDAPLPMDRDHAFGAFTESFDIMREELAAARVREAEANRSKKELVASLSHDIKTPVTSIKLVSELLLVTERESPAAEKIGTIYEKAEQIDRLITDMLHATLEDLGELKVNPEEKGSTILESMIRNSDYYGKVTMASIPGCLLILDPLRMEQVIDNIINNAYKYAGTDITVVSEVIDHCLRLEFRDYGKGVPEEELPKLTQKFYRGSNSQTSGKNGTGLGLYLSHYFMEKMGGELLYYNREDGFSVEIVIRLT